MKRLLIFTMSTGGGHNEAASNLKKEFAKREYEVNIVDVLHEMNKIFDTVVINSFNLVTGKFPKLYGKLYDFSNREKPNKLFSESNIKLFSEKILNIITEEQPDLIISTHSLLVNIIGYLKNEVLIDIPFIAIVTDYEAHIAYVNKNVDAYIAASDYTSFTLMKRGVKSNRIYPYGIPIKEEFLDDEDNEDNNDIEYNNFQILLMAGSLGLKGMNGVLENIIKLNRNFNIVVVCGHNEKLKKSIEIEFKDFIDKGKITVFDFTNNIPTLMDESDLLITKPGGLTISEAIAKGLPMVIPYFIPGQEKENLDYLLSEEIAIYVEDIDTIGETIEFLMDNPPYLKSISERMKNMYDKTCTDNIISLSNDLINQYKRNYKDNLLEENFYN